MPSHVSQIPNPAPESWPLLAMSRRHLLLCLRLNSPQISRLKIPTGAPSDFHAGEKEEREMNAWMNEQLRLSMLCTNMLRLHALHKYAT